MLLISLQNRTPKFTDQEILVALVEDGAGASDTILYLYRRVKPILLRKIQQANCPEPLEVCKDILQDGLLILIENLRSGKFREESSLVTYLISICRFVWMRRMRDLVRSDELRNDAPPEDGPPRFMTRYFSEQERCAGIQKVFQHLPEKCGELLRLFYWDRFDMESIANRLGYRDGNSAKSRKNRCQRALIDFLRENPQLLDLFQP